MLNPHGLAPMTHRLMAPVSICVFTFSSICAEGVKKKVRFVRGASSITLRNAVIRGDRDRYYVGAKAGQSMSVKITSTEKNAVFQIYFHGEEESLPGAGDEDDATNWSGELPIDNEYVIVVGGTRGNANYALTIAIK
jgi:hypothetical protein